MIGTVSFAEIMSRYLLAVFLAGLGLDCGAQYSPTYSLVVSPSDPQPEEVVSVFVRGTDASGSVLCPAARQRITAVSIAGSSILLQLSNVGTPGGVPEPYCDGNSVRIGPLPAGDYQLRASVVLSNGTVMPPHATASLRVAPLEHGRNYTALWALATEVGWGLNVTHQGDVVFGTLFTYDLSGSPLWLVMPAGMRQGGTNTFAGELFRTTGSAFNSEPFIPIDADNVTKVGSMTLSFSAPDAGVLTYDVDGRRVTKTVGKEVFGSRPAACTHTTESRALLPNYQDLWWNPSESGWGLNITHQDDVLFATLFTYGPDGGPLWFVMPAGRLSSTGDYSGDLYQTRGPSFDAQPWTDIEIARVGAMRLRFRDGESGTVDYAVGGSTVVKEIRRQVFGGLLPACR